MRLSDAGLHQRQTKALYPNHRLPPWLTEDVTRDRSNRLLDLTQAINDHYHSYRNCGQKRKAAENRRQHGGPRSGDAPSWAPDQDTKRNCFDARHPCKYQTYISDSRRARRQNAGKQNANADRNYAGWDQDAKAERHNSTLGHCPRETCVDVHHGSNDEVERRGASPA
jgi:hypothetical protein